MDNNYDEGHAMLRLLLAGKTGVGKSSTGNTILGRDAFRTGLSFGSVTRKWRSELATIRGRTIEVVDTPGILDAGTPVAEIAAVFRAVSAPMPGPLAILLVTKLDTRFTQEDRYAFQCLKAIFGDAVVNYVIVVFTGGDRLHDARKSLQDVKENATEDFLSMLDDCSHRCVVFNNFAQNTSPQVDNLLEEIDKMVAANGRSPYVFPRYMAEEQQLCQILDDLDDEEWQRGQKK